MGAAMELRHLRYFIALAETSSLCQLTPHLGEAVTEELYDEIFSTNVKGVHFTVQKLLPVLNDGGISSAAGPSN